MKYLMMMLALSSFTSLSFAKTCTETISQAQIKTSEKKKTLKLYAEARKPKSKVIQNINEQILEHLDQMLKMTHNDPRVKLWADYNKKLLKGTNYLTEGIISRDLKGCDISEELRYKDGGFYDLHLQNVVNEIIEPFEV